MKFYISGPHSGARGAPHDVTRHLCFILSPTPAALPVKGLPEFSYD